MSLTKTNQELLRDLKGIASDLKWSAVELMRIAEQLSESGNEHDAMALMGMCLILQASEDKAAGYADEVRDGVVVRSQI